jgi:hypothetical protein
MLNYLGKMVHPFAIEPLLHQTIKPENVSPFGRSSATSIIEPTSLTACTALTSIS